MTTLIAIVGESENWLDLELLHRRRWPFKNRREIVRVVGITRAKMMP